MVFLSYLISGIGLGSVYAIIALGYSMVYGIAKMLNFAHGDIIMVGAYVAFFALFRNQLGVLPATAMRRTMRPGSESSPECSLAVSAAKALKSPHPALLRKVPGRLYGRLR